ncbi:27939_t:CDS:2 [Gigaspora margarita]|uniref:27939_t:CDS:1 n=1 Tax=Gigaspora margarita TaxID=4874 RepID=A0ABN7VVJ8_GIGMA|nr:27939_t:CDS:2 [Gigaspora margarita]
MLKNDKENVYNISYLDKEMTRSVKPTNLEKKFLMVLSNVVNIIEVIIVLDRATEYNAHINGVIVRRITAVIKVIRSLTKRNNESNRFLNHQSFKTIQIFLLEIQKMINFINKEMMSLKVSLMYIKTNIVFKELMTEFESLLEFTIKMKTFSDKRSNKKTKYNRYFNDINECLNLATGIIYPIERDEANQLFESWKSNKEILKTFDESDTKMKPDISKYALLKTHPKANGKSKLISYQLNSFEIVDII